MELEKNSLHKLDNSFEVFFSGIRLRQEGGEKEMPTVYAKENEPFDILLKKFKKKCERASILSDIKKHQAYEKPSDMKKRKLNTARRKMLKNLRKLERYS